MNWTELPTLSIANHVVISSRYPFILNNFKVILSFLPLVAGNSVEVDESLFQEMDDLELEEDEDDPDYNPMNLDSD